MIETAKSRRRRCPECNAYMTGHQFEPIGKNDEDGIPLERVVVKCTRRKCGYVEEIK